MLGGKGKKREQFQRHHKNGVWNNLHIQVSANVLMIIIIVYIEVPHKVRRTQ